MTITIDLTSMNAPAFCNLVRKSSISSCTGSDPSWLTSAVAAGVTMTLPNVMIQAGRHFSDRVNLSTFVGCTKRQASTALAWTICNLISPTIEANRMVVEDPSDPDVKRLCSEIFGVGLGLEALRVARVIDGRTVRKLAGRFDFQARSRSAIHTVRIEAKGTFNNVSGSTHRNSISSKITAQGQTGNYSRNVGVIAALWTREAQGSFDLEIVDPEIEPVTDFEQAVREVIEFYAHRLDEAVGN